MTGQETSIEEAGELCKPKNNVIAKVISQEGVCWVGHKVDDEFQVLGGLTPAGLCPLAYHNMFHFAAVLLYGGAFTWARDPDKEERVACPDASNPVIFQLRRERKE
jgi:uncharacterized repeat protein (TIGR04076 family)